METQIFHYAKILLIFKKKTNPLIEEIKILQDILELSIILI